MRILSFTETLPSLPPFTILCRAAKEKVYVVGIAKKRSLGETDADAFSVEESLTELSELVGTAGLEVAGSTFQKVRGGREGWREGKTDADAFSVEESLTGLSELLVGTAG